MHQIKPVFASIVTDASPLISLERMQPDNIGASYFRILFGTVFIPEKAMLEVLRKPQLDPQTYLGQHDLEGLVQVVKTSVNSSLLDLDRLYDNKVDQDYEGEAYAISYAHACGLRLLIDDSKATSIAVANGVRVYNLATAAIKAFQAERITEFQARQIVKAAKDANIFGEKAYQQYLAYIQR